MKQKEREREIKAIASSRFLLKMRGIRYASRKEKVNHILPFSRVSIVRVENRTFLYAFD